MSVLDRFSLSLTGWNGGAIVKWQKLADWKETRRKRVPDTKVRLMCHGAYHLTRGAKKKE